MLQQHLHDFKARYGQPTYSILSPGRVNIIGEHTDYNGGRVLPFAIAKTLIITGNNTDSDFKVYSHRYDEEVNFSDTDSQKPSWISYLQSVISVLETQGHAIQNAKIMIGGNLDAGAGISSSSALSCGLLRLLDKLNRLNINADDIIKYASIAENKNGVLGGIMDQSCILKAKKGHALLLDCRYNECKHIPLNIEHHEWLIINSGVAHNLAETNYNNRTRECRQALDLLKEHLGLEHLRNLTKDHLDYLRMHHSTLAKRMRHVFMEDKRVTAMLRALDKSDGDKIGRLLSECHYSLSNLYEVSCKEIDFLIEKLQLSPHVRGARMIGGGFGGAVLCLIDKGSAKKLMPEIISQYYGTFMIELSYELVSAQDGLKVIRHGK